MLVYLCALVAIGALVVFLITKDSEEMLRRLTLGVFVLAATAAAYLHTTMLLFPGLAMATMIAARLSGAVPAYRLMPIIAAVALTYLLCGWAIYMATNQVLYESNNIAHIGTIGLNEFIRATIRIFSLSAHDQTISILLFLVNISVIGLFVWKSGEITRVLLILIVVSLLIFAVIGTQVAVFTPRTIFWISGPFLILLAAGLASIRPQGLRVAACSIIGALLVIDLVKMLPFLEREDWVRPVMVVSRIPGAALVVQGEAMAILSERACERISEATCPYQVIAVIDPAIRSDSWARDAFSGTKVSIADLPELLAGRPIFFFRPKYFYNLPEMLRDRGMGRDIPPGTAPFYGPYNTAALR